MRVLFLGEGDLSGSGRYLAAILRWSGIQFDHRPDQARVPKLWRKKSYGAIILSDYRYSSFTPCAREWLIAEVEKGTGLLMIGGWASFTGLVGGYAGTDIEKLLPVQCIRGDDRVQMASGALLLWEKQFITSSPAGFGGGPMRKDFMGSLPVDAGNDGKGRHSGVTSAPPVICGYHRVKTKPGTETAMVFRDLLYKGGRIGLGRPRPALVFGRHGRARTAAFLTDCAPHWAGGLVDWGNRRVAVRVAPGVEVEVGEHYMRFFENLIGSLKLR